MGGVAPGRLLAVCTSEQHRFSKQVQPGGLLLVGLGLAGDAHAGATVQHRSRAAQDPTQPNLRQVHLLSGETLAWLRSLGHVAAPGALGENLTTQGLDLHALPVGTQLQIGGQAVVKLTGLRNPCTQLEAYSPGLLGQLVVRGEDGQLIRRAGVMGVVRQGGEVRPGDQIVVTLPSRPWRGLERV